MITENIIVSHELSWIDIERPFKSDSAFIADEFNLPPVLMLTCMKPEQLPKFEKISSGHFFLLRIYDPWNESEDITIHTMTNKLAIFISESNVLTVHSDMIFPLKKYIDMKDDLFLPNDSRRLTHQLVSLCILSYEEALSDIQKIYEGFEKEILSEDKMGGILSNKRVYEFRRRLFVLKGLMQMTQRLIYTSAGFWRDCRELQQDVRENLDQLYFRLEGLSQNFDQLFALHLSINDRKNNEVMKVLTLFASIMLPLTFISSFYGMNFDFLPGIHSREGLVGVVLIMFTMTFMTIWFFARKDWFKQSM